MSKLHTLGLLNREGMKALNEGRSEDAIFQLIQADRLAKSMNSPLHEASVRNNIGLVHQQTGNIVEALACFRVAVESAVVGAGEGNILQKAIVRNMTRLESSVAELGA